MRIRTIRAAMLLGAAGAALAAVAALGTAPASAATSAPAKSVAASPARVGVHPNTIVFNCYQLYQFQGNTNIRSGAGTNNPIVGVGMPGQAFAATAETSYYYSGYRWVYGEDEDFGIRGWVAVELLKYLGQNCFAPIM